MWVYILSLFLLTKPVQFTAEEGTGFNFTFDCATFKESDTSVRIELYLKIPYSTLVFERLDSAFVGRFLVTAQVADQRKEPITGKEWEREIKVDDYNQSKQNNGYEFSQFNLNFNVSQDKKMTGSLKVEDLNSTKIKELDFIVEMPNRLSDLLLKKSGKLNPNHSYASTDTIEAYWEVYAVSREYDSCSIALVKDKKILGNHIFVPSDIRKSDRRRIAKYQAQIPISAFLELESGTYNLRLIYNPTREEKNVEITINSPFYLSTKEYLEKVDELRYIATDEELKQLRKATPTERQKVWQEFWKKKDPTPTTEENEVMEDYLNKIEYCKEHFGKGDKGYKSDRARVYLKYGPPDQIESHPFEHETQAYEIWYYYNRNLQFTFVDESGFGEYILTTNQELLR